MFKVFYAILLSVFFVNIAHSQDNNSQLSPIPIEQIQWKTMPNLAFKEGEEPFLIFYSDCDENGKYLSRLTTAKTIYVSFMIHKNGKIVSVRPNFANQNIQLGRPLTKRLLEARFQPISAPKHLLKDGKYYYASLNIESDTKLSVHTRPTPQCQAILQKLATETTQTPQNEPVSATPLTP